jgi:hypothetical protein
VKYLSSVYLQGLEQASKLFYSDGDLVEMFNQLDELHQELQTSVSLHAY